jgi:LuxR family quorum sensing-dependent transcriptional regulator
MPRASPDVGREAFDFIDAVQGLSTAGEIMEAMQAVLGRFGFEFFCFNFLPTPQQSFADVLLANRLPGGWLDLYVEKQFVHVDPSIRHCRTTFRPYRWFKDAPYDPEHDSAAVEVVQRATDFGLLDGYVIPIASTASRVGHVWMGGETLDPPAHHLPVLHLMALSAFDRVFRLHLQARNEATRLSPREREVLTWTALGKSAWEIGEILTISQRTVHEHMINVRRKLHAVNTTQAVMIAIRDQIIEP